MDHSGLRGGGGSGVVSFGITATGELIHGMGLSIGSPFFTSLFWRRLFFVVAGELIHAMGLSIRGSASVGGWGGRRKSSKRRDN